jgi:hypothetical protein
MDWIALHGDRNPRERVQLNRAADYTNINLREWRVACDGVAGLGSKSCIAAYSEKIFIAIDLQIIWMRDTWILSLNIHGRRLIPCPKGHLRPVG